jgi:hypothetical protein
MLTFPLEVGYHQLAEMIDQDHLRRFFQIEVKNHSDYGYSIQNLATGINHNPRFRDRLNTVGFFAFHDKIIVRSYSAYNYTRQLCCSVFIESRTSSNYYFNFFKFSINPNPFLFCGLYPLMLLELIDFAYDQPLWREEMENAETGSI